MKITIVQGPFLPVPTLRGGAVEKMWFELGKQFSSKGHTIVHISCRFTGLPNVESISSVTHIRIRGYDWPSNPFVLKFLDFFYSLRALASLPNADILITNTFWLPIFASFLQFKFGKVIVDVQRIPKGQLPLYFLVSALRANSNAVVNSIYIQAPFLKKKVFMVPNPLPYFESNYRLEKQNIILFAGRIHPEKGIELLLRSFVLACSQGLTNWTLRLVGSAERSEGGGGSSWLSRLKSISGLSNLPVEFIGPLHNQESLHYQYQVSSIFAYPSLADKGESFGMAPLEAMSFGTVPIVSSVACFRDFITNGENGLIFDHHSSNSASLLAQQIILLASSPDLLKNLSLQARLVNSTHNPSKIADCFLSEFQNLKIS